MGLIAGILYSFGGLLIDTLVSFNLLQTSETPGFSTGTLLAFGALIGIPLIFATIGFVAGIFEAILFNMVSKLIGGFGFKWN